MKMKKRKENRWRRHSYKTKKKNKKCKQILPDGNVEGAQDEGEANEAVKMEKAH